MRHLAVVAGIAVAWWLSRRQGALSEAALGCPGEWELVEQDGQRLWRCVPPDGTEAVLVRYVPPTERARAVARLAVRRWTVPDAILMTAIAGEESRWDPAARGDCRGGYWSCQGCQSWGLWQIRMPVWAEVLQEQLGAPSRPCDLARWLTDPENNASAADLVRRAHGMDAWTAYVSGRWRLHASVATSAVLEEARGGPILA